VVTSQCLGTGSFASVHLALDPKNHRQVACKSIRTKKGHEIPQVMKEVKILMTLKHVRTMQLDLFFFSKLKKRLSKPNINEIYDTEEHKKFV
jgi:serine/threonine protein kinase